MKDKINHSKKLKILKGQNAKPYSSPRKENRWNECKYELSIYATTSSEGSKSSQLNPRKIRKTEGFAVITVEILNLAKP